MYTLYNFILHIVQLSIQMNQQHVSYWVVFCQKHLKPPSSIINLNALQSSKLKYELT